MVRPFFHGIVASSAGGGPSVPLNFDVSWPGEASTKLYLSWTSPADTAGGITGYQIIKDGSVLVADTGNNTTNYTATGLTTSQSYSFQVAGISNSGIGVPCTAVAKSTIAAVSLSISGSYQAFYGTGQDGYLVYQARGSGSFYVSSNPDSAPISVWVVGGGGGAYNPWTAPGGGGGGAVYWLDEATNIPVGSSHTMSYTLGAGAAGSSSYGGTSSTCTNLHYSSGSWSTVTAGRGMSQSGSTNQTAVSGGAGAGAYAAVGGQSTEPGYAGNTASTGNIGGTGGSSTPGGPSGYWSTGWSAGGGGGGGGVGYTASFPGTGGTGGNGYGWGTSGSYGGNGGTSFAFNTSNGLGEVHGGQGSSGGGYIMIDGIGGGGGGSSFGVHGSTVYGGQGGYAYHGGGRAVHSAYRVQYGGFSGPGGQTNPYVPSGDRNMHGLTHSGGGAGSVANGYVYYGNGGSGGVYIRIHQ